MNIKHRNAQWAARASVDFFTYRYFKYVSDFQPQNILCMMLRKNGPMEVDSLVIAVRKNGFKVQIPRFGIEGIK